MNNSLNQGKEQQTSKFSAGIANDLKNINKALQRRKDAMKLSSVDRERVFCFSSSK